MNILIAYSFYSYQIIYLNTLIALKLYNILNKILIFLSLNQISLFATFSWYFFFLYYYYFNTFIIKF